MKPENNCSLVFLYHSFFFLFVFIYLSWGGLMLLVDKEKIYIKEYKELLVMEPHFFRILMEHYCLDVRGENLEVYYYDQNEIRLNGRIKVIEYNEDRV